ncbi:MAG TPA: 16S rRNA (cytidine(1402)-2'-O)-methyltransferase [Candidatus Bipolaricaulota bacterium]|nr:16S rRNA (cytidine(1402)-2'-O)-methyltransferase [Candidatus Bipolaricaulota bacterium]
MESGNLYIAATPIGNLKDITYRVVETLKEANLIVCEDTRHTRKLLTHYGIDKPTISYHQHSSPHKIKELIEKIKGGQNVVYVSDAGTPNVSDPGGKLAEAAAAAGITTIPLPGPAAFSTLISVAGLPMDNFIFLGFLPHKKGRRKIYEKIMNSEIPVIFYESVHRIMRTLGDLAELMPERQMVIGRELTKMHETIYRGKIESLKENFSDSEVKGEFAVIVAGNKKMPRLSQASE